MGACGRMRDRASPRLDNPRENVYNENTKGAARKRLAPYRTAYQKRLTVKYLGKHSWRSVFFAFMILVVMADLPRDVEDTIRYAVSSNSTSDRVMRIPPFAEASGGYAQKSRPPDACLLGK